MEAPVRLCCFLVLFCHFVVVPGNINVQNQYECGSYQYPREVRVTDRDEDIISSQAQEYYASDRNCLLTIIGKKNYQIELELRQIDLDGHAYATDHCGGLCCNDFLKIFNSYRADNARLLPGMSQWGLCGNELPTKVVYQTTQNYVTLQFRSDRRNDYKTGFSLRFRQYPWRNPGNLLPDGGVYGGWNDGSRSELQVDWSDQSQVPGGYIPGSPGNDYDKDKGGLQCYECQGCDLEFFDPKREVAAIKGGCYVCSKTWKDDFASAQRLCYTQLQFTNLLLTLVDSSVGGGKAEEFRGCKRFMDAYGVSLNFCICDDENLCNSAGRVHVNILAVIALILAVVMKH
ncbi:uncharacterized protein LOC124133589 [Haliotis rufescens]|uniref:uncharacterized protein LOC124133589 n=1 Tax=Haliotis rufescens TaxID=6454 RepID=UPI00201F38A3|nr:uncharacterized protein LOC124133589 [Haliotis rufescens]